MKKDYVYIRVVRELTHTVLVVGQRDKTSNGFNGQKKFFDNVFKRWVGFASGNTIKRHIVERLVGLAGEVISPTIFQLKKKKGEDNLTEDIVINTCNPNHLDQLIRGYMLTSKDKEVTNVKRRSPLSVSALTPIHPLLAQTYGEMSTVDRSGVKGNTIRIIDENNKEIDEEGVKALLSTEKGSKVANHRKLIDKNGRMTGIYEFTIAIDISRLFSVELKDLEPEISPAIEQELRENGWTEEDRNGFIFLVAPKAIQEKIVQNIGNAIVNFRILSNQSSTFSTMPVLAVSVTKDASLLHKAIVPRITKGSEDDPSSQTIALQINDVAGMSTFITTQMAKYVLTDKDTLNAEREAIELITTAILGSIA